MLVPPSTLLPIQILVNTLIYNSLQSSYCLTFVTEADLVVNLPSNMSAMRIQPNGSDFVNQILGASEKGCSDYIVQMYEPESFMVAFEKVNHLGDVRRSDRKLIFLPMQDEFYNANVLTDVLSLKEASFVANILLIAPAARSSDDCDCESFDIITHKYVGPDDEIHNPLYLDRWNSCSGQFEKGVNLFPHDMSNLYGKTLKVAAFTYKPYVLLDLDPNVVPQGRDGIDIRVIDEFCRWINCTVEIVTDEYTWGEIYENNTGVGILGNVYEDRADIGITSLYSWFEEWMMMDFSAPLVRTTITCISPAARVLSSWDLPLLPFSWVMWMCIMFTFFYASFALFVAQRSADKIFLSTFGMMVTQHGLNSRKIIMTCFEHNMGSIFRGQLTTSHGGQLFTACQAIPYSLPREEDIRDSWRIRSVTGWLLLTGLIIDNAYGGGLASSFTVPKYEPSIDTVQDMVDRKVEWGATTDAWLYSIILSEEPLIKTLMSQFKVYPIHTLKQKSFDRSMSFSIEHLPAGSFAIGEYITKEAAMELEIMLENIYYEQCVVYARKSSPYTAKISELVGRLHNSGLLLTWETQVALKYLDFEVQLEVRLSRSRNDIEEIKPLSLGQLYGIYIFYFIGLTIACLGFIGELLSKCGTATTVI